MCHFSATDCARSWMYSCTQLLSVDHTRLMKSESTPLLYWHPEDLALQDVDLEGADAGPPAHTLEAVEPSEAAAQTGEAAVKVDDVMEEATVENGAAARTVAGQGQDRKVKATVYSCCVEYKFACPAT